MNDKEIKHGERSSPVVFVMILLAFPLLLLLPLALSLVEHSTMGTNHVYEWCDQIGIARPLGEIYRPVLRFFDNLI